MHCFKIECFSLFMTEELLNVDIVFCWGLRTNYFCARDPGFLQRRGARAISDVSKVQQAI